MNRSEYLQHIADKWEERTEKDIPLTDKKLFRYELLYQLNEIRNKLSELNAGNY